MTEPTSDTRRKLWPFLSSILVGGVTWISAEVLLTDYNDLLHVALAIAGFVVGWVVGVVLASQKQ